METVAVRLHAFIEHTLLNPYCSLDKVETLCAEALNHHFHGVCVIPYFVRHAKNFLVGTDIKVVTVVGFPFGYNHTPAKVEEVRKVIDAGADEIDMVMNIAALKNADWNVVTNDVESVCTMVRMHDKIIKVIIESGVLSPQEIIKACEICAQVGVNFVKTSTGYAGQGATVEAVQLMRRSLPDKIKIKASGGIRTKEFALQLIQAGAERIGTSAGVQLITE